MLLTYEWPGLWGETPAQGTFLDVSGDPDKPVLHGVVARVDHDEGEPPVLSILLGDGQEGSAEFQQWVVDQGDIGVVVSERQVVFDKDAVTKFGLSDDT